MTETDKIIWPGWETVRVLGHGSFGAVYEIQRDLRGHKEYAAVKVIKIPHGESEIDTLRTGGYDDESLTQYFNDSKEQIEGEYAVMADMKGHSNIVYCDDIRSVQHENGFGWDIFMKMELLTPMKTVAADRVPEEDVIKLGADIANALVFCESQHIVHRDIKPENIFIARDGNYKLGDFGIAKTMEGTTGGTLAGSFDYMAPEVRNNMPYGTKADIYSLGIVLYWLLNDRKIPFLQTAGKRPTPSEKTAARDRRFAGEQIPAPMYGSDELKRIVLKACAYDPKDRYASARELLDDLNVLRYGTAAVQNSGVEVQYNTAAEDNGSETEYVATEYVETEYVATEYAGTEYDDVYEKTVASTQLGGGTVLMQEEKQTEIPAGEISGNTAVKEKKKPNGKLMKIIIPAAAAVVVIAVVLILVLGGNNKDSGYSGGYDYSYDYNDDSSIGSAVSDASGGATDNDTQPVENYVQITAQPQDVSAKKGETVTVTVKATGDGLTYKWYYKQPGKTEFTYTDSFTGDTYSVEMDTSRDGRQVYCVITDKYGNEVTTDTVTLTMLVTLAITEQPKSVTVAKGEKATVKVVAEGEGLTYKWYYKQTGKTEFTATDSITGDTYSVEMDTSRDGRQVYCVVTDKYGNEVKSDVATLSMIKAVEIKTQPKNVSVANGEKATVKVVAEGEGLTYKWYYKDKGASKFSYTDSFKDNTYTVEMNDARNGRQVYCVITDKYGNEVTTETVTLKMK